MHDAIRDYLPWLLSAITIWMTLLAGNVHPKAWLVGLGNQLLWLIWIVATGTWGLIPLNVALWVVYGRNHWKWNARNRQHDRTEARAKEIYAGLKFDGPGTKPAWVAGGNSLKQDEARDMARVELSRAR